MQWDILIGIKNKELGDGVETTLEFWPDIWKNGDISMPHKDGEKISAEVRERSLF